MYNSNLFFIIIDYSAIATVIIDQFKILLDRLNVDLSTYSCFLWFTKYGGYSFSVEPWSGVDIGPICIMHRNMCINVCLLPFFIHAVSVKNYYWKRVGFRKKKKKKRLCVFTMKHPSSPKVLTCSSRPS